MILRRFTQHIKEQNWFAVFLDFIVVVVGIYLGLQVNNFNEERNDRQEEKAFTVRLLEDARYNEKQIAHVIERHQQRASAAKAALDLLMDPDAVIDNPGEVALMMILSVDISSVSLSTGTFDELISSGKMGLLRDNKLKKLIQDEAGIHRFTLGSLENFRALATNPIPFLHKHITHSSNPQSAFLTETYNFDTLRADQEFVGAVQNSIGAVLSFVEYRNRQLKSVQNVRAYLNCKLNNEDCEQSASAESR